MASSTSPPTLQIAQVLADLNSLKQADPKAAHALLSANKTLTARLALRRNSSRPSITSLPTSAPTTPGTKFDRLGRRVVPSPSASIPGLRKFSSTGSGYFNSVENSRRGSVDSDNVDEDMERAQKLVEYYEKRDRLRQLGDSGLARSQERVDAALARSAQRELSEREKIARQRHLGVRS